MSDLIMTNDLLHLIQLLSDCGMTKAWQCILQWVDMSPVTRRWHTT